MRFTRKPYSVEAVQVVFKDGKLDFNEKPEWLTRAIAKGEIGEDTSPYEAPSYYVAQEDGPSDFASNGWWILAQGNGSFVALTNTEFKDEYEVVD